mgnify:CR=1 FL=1
MSTSGQKKGILVTVVLYLCCWSLTLYQTGRVRLFFVCYGIDDCEREKSIYGYWTCFETHSGPKYGHWSGLNGSICSHERQLCGQCGVALCKKSLMVPTCRLESVSLMKPYFIIHNMHVPSTQIPRLQPLYLAFSEPVDNPGSLVS